MTQQEVFEKTFARVQSMIHVGNSANEDAKGKEKPFVAGARFAIALGIPMEFFTWVLKEIVKKGKKIEDITDPDKIFIYWLEKVWMKK